MSCSKMQNSCKECKKKCLRVHGNRPFCSFSTISAVPSFFKIMIGDFGKAMFIPPKFARTLGGQVNKNMCLEDSVGNCWMVKLSEIDGSLAFQQGWHDFVVDHSISLGEIVIFKHISLSLFTVQIYGTSGSERLQFQGKENSNNRKRKRNKNEITPDILCLSKAQKSCEASERKHITSNKGSFKKDRVEKNFPRCLASNEMAARKGSSKKDRVDKAFSCYLASNEMAARNLVTRSAGEHTHPVEESPAPLATQFLSGSVHEDECSLRLHNSLTVNYSEAPEGIINLSKKVEKAGRNSPIVLSDDEDSDTVILTKDDSFSSCDKSKECSKNSEKEHAKNRKENLAAVNRSTNRCLLTMERNSSLVRKDAVFHEGVIKITSSTSVYPESSESKKNLKGENVSLVNEEKMSHHEKAVTVEHIKDRRELAAHNRSDSMCLLTVEKNSFVIDENPVCKQEAIQITPITTVHSERLQAKRNPQDKDRSLEVNEKNLSHQHCSPKRLEAVSTADCHCETEPRVEESSVIDTHPFANERVPMVGCSQGQNITEKDQMTNVNIERNNSLEPIEFSSKLDDKECVDHCYEISESATPDCFRYEGGDIVVSKEFASKSLVMGEGICYTTDEDSNDKVEVIIDSSIGLCAAKADCNVLGADKASIRENSPEVPSSNPILNCNGDDQGNSPPSHKGIINYNQIEGDLGNHTDPSQDRAVKSSPLVIADMSESHKNLSSIKGDLYPSGVVSGEFPEVDAEKVTPCSRGKILAVVKTEIMDSSDVMSLNYAEFSITVSLISQSWLLLPERLPARLFKKRCLRKVVLLQDPTMRLWPVLYHESLDFIGFVGGWEDFATENNLQQGDTCQIESVSASEPTFKVQFLNVQNPT